MRRMFVFEMKRGFDSGTFRVSLLFGCVISVASFFLIYNAANRSVDTQTVMYTWLGTNYILMFNFLYYVLLPLLAALPFGASYFQDLKTGYIKNICVKASRAQYFTAKSAAVFCTAAAAVTLPLVLNLMLCMRVFPLRIPEPLAFYGSTTDAYLFADVYYDSSLAYCLLFILIDGLAAGLMALFSICVAELSDSAFIVITAPFVVYLITGTLFSEGGKKNFSLMNMLDPNQKTAADESRLFCLLLLLLLTAVLWIFCKARRKDIL